MPRPTTLLCAATAIAAGGGVVASMGLLRRHRALRIAHDELRALQRCTAHIDGAVDTEDLITRILDGATVASGARHATLLLVDEGRTTRTDNAGGRISMTWVSQRSVERLLAASGEGLVWDGGGEAGSPRPGAELLDDGACLVVPLRHPDVTGALVLSGEHLDGDGVRDVGRGIARHAAAALAEARLLDRIREERHRVEQAGLTDRLTGFRNTEGLVQAVPALPAGAVLLLRLANLSQVRTSLGHGVGERVEARIGQRLRDLAADGRVLVGALGGGRFAVVAPDADTVPLATEAVQAVLATCADPVEEGPLSLDVAAQVGIALAPAHGQDIGELLRAASTAASQADEGGLAVAWFDADYDRQRQERLHLARRLRAALDADALSVAYQPKVDLRTGRVIGVEALARWHDEVHGDVPPVTFVEVAERTGLIRPLTLAVFRHALAQAERWRRAGLDLGVAVNVSLAVMRDTDLARQVAAMVRAHDVSPERITIEITESQVMEDLGRGSRVLAIFGAVGCRLSVDDFGTGYSSLAQVKNLPVQELKIDRTFITDLADSATDQAITTSVLRLAGDLGLEVVAEGIEDERARRLLAELGCHVGQGYLFARPVPAAEVATVVARIQQDAA